MAKDDLKNIYQRDGIWWLRKKMDGFDHRESLHTSVHATALKKRNKRLDELKLENDENRKRWAVAALEWLKVAPGKIKTSTLTRYKYSIKNVSPFLADRYLDEINKPFIANLAAQRRAMGVTNATIRRDLTAIASVLDHAEDLDWIDGNPARDFSRRIKERRDPIVLPRVEDIEFVVSRAPGNFANMIRFAQFTGMRQEEIASMSIKQIRENTLDLTRTKTNTPRSIEMDDRARGTLGGTVRHFKTTYVFWHGQGSRYHNVASQFRRIMRLSETAAEKDGRDFAPFRFHDLRHWYAVDYLRHGAQFGGKHRPGNIYTLQKNLGHSSIKTTEIYLAHLTAEEAEGAQKGAQANWFEGKSDV